MKSKLLAALLVSVAFIPSFPSSSLAATKKEAASAKSHDSGGDEVLAVAGGNPIYKNDVEKALQRFAGAGQEKPDFSKLDPKMQKEFLDSYIGSKLLYQEGIKQKVQESSELKSRLKEIEEQLVRNIYISNLIQEQKTDQKIHELYDGKYKGKQGEKELRARHILVKTEDEAKKIRDELSKGADFEKLAKEKSTDPQAASGGDLGYFTESQMVPEFSKAAFALKAGEISQPVKTDFGWHIIKVEDVRSKSVPSFEDAKPGLEAELSRTIVESKVKALMETAKVDYKIQFGSAKPEAQPEPKVVKVDEKGKATEKKAEEKKPEAKAEPKPEEKKEKPASSAKASEKLGEDENP